MGHERDGQTFSAIDAKASLVQASSEGDAQEHHEII
jgi:hypothetical protein